MKVTYDSGIPTSITIENDTYTFKRFQSASNKWLYSVTISNTDYIHNSDHSLAIMNQNEITDIYVSRERSTNHLFSGDSYLYPNNCYQLYKN